MMKVFDRVHLKYQEEPKGYWVSGVGYSFFLYALKRVSPVTGKYEHYLEADAVCTMDDPADQRLLTVVFGDQTASLDIIQTKVSRALKLLFQDRQA